MYKIIVDISLFILVVTAALCIYRIIVGPSVVDKIIASDTLTSVVVSLLVVIACAIDSKAILLTAVGLCLVSFVGIVVVTKYIAAEHLNEEARNDIANNR